MVEDGKYLRAARELQMKQGPSYDRWKAAMEARGEQKRCMECVHFYDGRFNPRYPITGMSCGRADRYGGEFACRHFHLRE